MLQNIAGAVRRAARVLNPVTVVDVVQQQSKGWASGCEVSSYARFWVTA